MNRKQLEYFIKLANTGNFSRAAGELYATPSALIHQINQLEGELGIKLFSRNSRGVQLTRSGEVFYRGAIRLLDDLDAVIKESKLLEEGKAILRLAFWSKATPDYLGSLAALYRAEYADVRIVISESSMEKSAEDLASGLFDLCLYKAFWKKQFQARSLLCTPLLGDQLCGLFLPKDPLVGKEALTFEDLCDRRIVVYDIDNFSSLSNVTLAAHKIQVIEKSSLALPYLFQAALDGSVILVLRGHLPYLYPMVGVPIRDVNTVEVGLACRNENNPAVRSFIEFAKSRYADLHPSGKSGSNQEVIGEDNWGLKNT